MTNPRPLSVEVFRDGKVPPDALFDAEVGLRRIERMVGGISIVGMTRTLGLVTDSMGRIDMYRTPWAGLDADVNVVLSDKRFPEPEPDDADRKYPSLGEALNDTLPGGLRVAVVDSNHGHVDATVSHELGHLVDLAHCRLQRCIMHAYQSEHGDQLFCHHCKGLLGRNILRSAARNLRHADKLKQVTS